MNFFEFNLTAYLRKNCCVELQIKKKNEKKAYVLQQHPHTYKIIVKLHQVKFHSNKVIFEKESYTRTKRLGEQNLQQSRSEFKSSFSENEVFQRSYTVPQEKLYDYAVTSRSTKNCTAKQMTVFEDNIIRGIRVSYFS